MLSRIPLSAIRSVLNQNTRCSKAVKNTQKSRSYATPSGEVTSQTAKFQSFGGFLNLLEKKQIKLENETVGSKLGDNQVLVKMSAAPIHPADINIIQGVYPVKTNPPSGIGIEGFGKVVSVGSKVTNVKVNDNVHVLPSTPGVGTWRTYGVYDSKDTTRVGPDIDPYFASTLVINPGTALRLLSDFVALKPGDVIIQNAANSMVGMAVAQIAKSLNLKTISIVRRRCAYLFVVIIAKSKEGARNDYQDVVEQLKDIGDGPVIPEDYLETPQFKELISDLPKPKLALNAVGGKRTVTEMARNLAEGGTLVTYGAMSHEPVVIPSSLFIFNDIQLKGFWMYRWLQQHSAAERAQMMDSIVSLIRTKKLTFNFESWKLEQLERALQRYAEPQIGRKLVLTMGDTQ